LPDAPSRLRVEHLGDAVGIGTTRPRLSWWLPEGARRQLAYRIRADNGWDTGRVESADSVLVEYVGAPLSSGARVAWQAKVWDGPSELLAQQRERLGPRPLGGGLVVGGPPRHHEAVLGTREDLDPVGDAGVLEPLA
jgi:hypothetical protein